MRIASLYESMASSISFQTRVTISKVIVSGSKIRFETNGLFTRLDGLLITFHPLIRPSQITVSFGEIGLELDGLFTGFDRFIIATDLSVGGAQILMDSSLLRDRCEGPVCKIRWPLCTAQVWPNNIQFGNTLRHGPVFS